MKKKGLLVLTLVVFIAGIAFAQPKNTITVDVGPLIAGATFGMMADRLNNASGTSGFGIAGQFERGLSPMLSLAGRFAYLGMGGGYTKDDDNMDIDISSWSAEANLRFYPFAQTFFLNGMVGFTNLAADFSGSAVDNSFSGSRNYVKFGAKVGWRFVFGREGGFVFEPSFGYVSGIGLGNSFESRIKANVEEDAGDFIDFFNILEQFIFVGGPRISLAFGWNF